MNPKRLSLLAALLACLALASQACGSGPSAPADNPSAGLPAEQATLPPTVLPTPIPTEPPAAATATLAPTPVPATPLDFRSLDDFIFVPDPQTPGRLYLKPTRFENTVYASADGGSTWSSLDALGIAGIPAAALNRFLLDAGPGFSSVIFGAGLGEAIVAADPQEPGRLYATDETGTGLMTSPDGGASWEPAGALPGPAPAFQGMAVLTGDPLESGTLYLNTQSSIFKSADGGKSWREINAGFPRPQSAPLTLGMLVFEPLTAATLYFSDPFYGLYRSTNGGEQWEEITRPELQQIASIAVDPQDANSLYLAFKFVNKLYYSPDGGKSWSEAALGPPGNDVRGYVIDPLAPAVRYAISGSGAVSGLFKSEDGGATWSEVASSLLP
jgi:photosystem II stability/assembly factor-like uncharacterized protein